MAELIDVNSIINEQGELCGQPLLDAFTRVNELCAQVELLQAQTNPDGALLANGTVQASNCLSYASDAQVCAGDGDIPSWGQITRLFNCEKIEATTGSGGEFTLPDVTGNGKVFVQLVEPRPVGVVGVELSADNTTITAIGPTGSPAGGETFCVQILEFFG